ncbi:MAG: hypothetical protein IAE65_11325, partial [Ignavibacteria bacterium]|nr:hypothetical protein [Ignavibacteria bacterium]
MNEETININSEILNFISKNEAPFYEFVSSERNKYNYSLINLNYYYFITNYISSQRIEALDDDKILFTIYNKAALDLLGIYNCLNNGLEIQAHNILRSLFENYLNCRIIFEINIEEEIKKRLKLYREYKYFKRWKHIENCRENNLEVLLSDEKVKQAESEYEKVKENYNFNAKNPHWSFKIYNKSLNNFEFSEKFKMIEEYRRIYPSLSISSHNSPLLEDYYAENNVVSNSPKFTTSTISISVLTIDYCKQIIELILDYLKPVNYKDIILHSKNFYYDFVNHSSVIKKLFEYNNDENKIGINNLELEAFNLRFYDHLPSYFNLKLKILELELTCNSYKSHFYNLRFYLVTLFEKYFNLFLNNCPHRTTYNFEGRYTINKFSLNNKYLIPTIIKEILECYSSVYEFLFCIKYKDEKSLEVNNCIDFEDLNLLKNEILKIDTEINETITVSYTHL